MAGAFDIVLSERKILVEKIINMMKQGFFPQRLGMGQGKAAFRKGLSNQNRIARNDLCLLF